MSKKKEELERELAEVMQSLRQDIVCQYVSMPCHDFHISNSLPVLMLIGICIKITNLIFTKSACLLAVAYFNQGRREAN